MPTECTPRKFEFEAVGRHAVVAGFDLGDMTIAGALLRVDRILSRRSRNRRLDLPSIISRFFGSCEVATCKNRETYFNPISSPIVSTLELQETTEGTVVNARGINSGSTAHQLRPTA